jgi:hypothetical protein
MCLRQAVIRIQALVRGSLLRNTKNLIKIANGYKNNFNRVKLPMN